MARIEYVRSFLGGLDAPLKTALNSIFEYLLGAFGFGAI